MKDEFVKRYNENLVKAVKADFDGRTRTPIICLAMRQAC